jgi:hypothetical protein
MRTMGPALLSTVFLAAMFLVACNQSSSSSPLPTTSAAEKVFIVFEGPWAFAPDPKNVNSVLAIAPRTTGHRELYVKASNQSTLVAGVYDLSLPLHSAQSAAIAYAGIAQAKVDSQNLQLALESKSARYVIRLPKPEQYMVSARAKSRVGATYPPDASTENNYATAVSLRYNVGSLNGFSLSGTPDSGAFNPLLLQVETPTIRFIIETAQDDDPKDMCRTQSRESFRDLTQLLGLTLYVDFPDNPDDCHSNDPQNSRPPRASIRKVSPFHRLGALLAGNLLEAQASSLAGGTSYFIDPESLGGRINDFSVLEAAFYFFGHPTGDCQAPDLILSPSP